MKHWGARKLEVSKEVECVVCVPDVCGECLDQGGENGVQVGRDEFRGAGACGVDGLAGVIGPVDLGEQVELDSAGLGVYKAGNGGGKVARNDEIMDGVGDGGLMGHGGVVVKGK
eukprot:g42440.t1